MPDPRIGQGEDMEEDPDEADRAREEQLDETETQGPAESHEVDHAEDADDDVLGGQEKRAASHVRTLFANCAPVCARLHGQDRELLGKKLTTPGCKCPQCTAHPTPEDVQHVLGRCPQWSEQREPLTRLLNDRGIQWDDVPLLFRETGVVPSEMVKQAEAGTRQANNTFTTAEIATMHSAYANILRARWDWWKEHRKQEERERNARIKEEEEEGANRRGSGQGARNRAGRQTTRYGAAPLEGPADFHSFTMVPATATRGAYY